MNILFLWHPYQAYMPTAAPVIQRLIGLGAGEISAPDVAAEPISTLKEHIAGASVIVVDQSFLNAVNDLAPNYNWSPDRPVRSEAMGEVLEHALNSSAFKVLGLTLNDLHWISTPGNPSFCSSDLKCFCRRFNGLIWGYEHWGQVVSGALPPVDEAWMKTAGPAVENWKTLIDAIPARFDFPWAIDPSEIRTPASRHRWDASVVGAPYESRVEAKKSARAAGLRCAPYDRGVWFLRKRLRIQRIVTRRRDMVRESRLWTNLMERIVTRSRANFVCGGGYRYFVRKHLEMAAVGACMASWPAAGADHYGFADGRNVAGCREPGEFGEVARRLRADPSIAAALGRAAQALVMERHTLGVRAAQLLEWLRILAKGKACSGIHRDGVFSVTEN